MKYSVSMLNSSFYLDVLKEEFKKRQAQYPLYSVSAFARLLHLDCSDLSKTLKGKRELSPKAAALAIQMLSLDQERASKFMLSVALRHFTAYLKRNGLSVDYAMLTELLEKEKTNLPPN